MSILATYYPPGQMQSSQLKTWKWYSRQHLPVVKGCTLHRHPHPGCSDAMEPCPTDGRGYRGYSAGLTCGAIPYVRWIWQRLQPVVTHPSGSPESRGSPSSRPGPSWCLSVSRSRQETSSNTIPSSLAAQVVGWGAEANRYPITRDDLI